MPFEVSMSRVSHTFNRDASLRVARAASHLHQASKQLAAATNAVPDRYHQRQLRRLLADLRGLSLPFACLASSLQRGGGR
jgi:hypothetical protein